MASELGGRGFHGPGGLETGKAPLTSTRRKRAGVTTCGAVLAVVSGVGLLKTDYLDPRSVVAEGRPGVFILSRCESAGGSDQGPSTFCHGDFRADKGRLNLSDIRLEESRDAQGMDSGDTFEAHALRPEPGRPVQLVRTDDQGDSDLAMRGVGAAGLTLLGVMLGGFAGRVVMAPGPARSRLGALLGIGTVVSALLWLIGTGAGGGFWA